MGSDIEALSKIVEQCDPACIIGVSSPGPGEHASCTDSNQTRNVLFRLNVPQTCVKNVAWLVTHRSVSAQNEQATQGVLQIQLPSLTTQRKC